MCKYLVIYYQPHKVPVPLIPYLETMPCFTAFLLASTRFVVELKSTGPLSYH